MTYDCSCHGAEQRLSQISKSGLERPRYSPGHVLEDSDLNAAVAYTRNLNQLLFRSLFGCGVICGLTASARVDCGLEISVQPGLALDGCGDPLELREPMTFHLGPKDGVPVSGDPEARDFWIIACAGETQCRPRAVVCDDDDLEEVRQATRTQSTVRIAVTDKPPECVCACANFRDLPGDARERRAALDQHAARILPLPQPATQTPDASAACCADPHGCHEKHRTDPACPADCGCGVACACGCCVLLAWVHWFEKEIIFNGREVGGWTVLHDGVRRSVRPVLGRDSTAGRDARPPVASPHAAVPAA